jgi:hypothetical protein
MSEVVKFIRPRFADQRQAQECAAYFQQQTGEIFGWGQSPDTPGRWILTAMLPDTVDLDELMQAIGDWTAGLNAQVNVINHDQGIAARLEMN